MAELGTASVRVVPDLDSLNAAVGGYFASSKWSSLGKAAGVALGAGLAAGGVVKGLYEIGQAFDDANDKFRAQTGATGKRLASLNKSFKDVLGDVPANFEDASDAVGSLNQRLGLTGGPLQKMSKQMLELSRITDTDVKTNIESVSKAFRDWEVPTKDQSETLNQLFRLSQKSGIGVAELATSVQKFGSPLRQLGFTLQESAAMFAEFERSGVNTQTMVPGLKLAISNLTRPTEELGASMQKLGINVGKPDVALRQVFDLLSEKGLPTVEKTGLAMDVFGKRAGADMAEAIRQGRFEVDELLNVMENGRETIRKAGRDTMDFGEQWELLKNNVLIALEPVATEVFGAIGDEARELRKILTDKRLTTDEKFSAVIEQIGDIAEKYGPKIAEAGGKIGVALLKGIANAFVNSNLLGKLFIGGAAIRLFGGAGAVSALGKKMGGRIGRTAGRYAGPAFALAFITFGLTDKKFRDAAVEGGKRLGELIVNALIDAVNAGLDNIEQVLDKANILAAVGVDAPNFGDIGHVAFSNYQKVIDSGVRDSAERGLEAVRGLKSEIKDLSKAMDDTRPSLKNNAERIDMMGDNLKALRSQVHTGREVWQDYGKGVSNVAEGVSDAVDRHRDRARGDLKDVGKRLDHTRGDADRYADGADKSFDRASDSAKRMAKRVSGSTRSLADAVRGGMENIAENTNEALKSFNVKKLAFSFKKVGAAAGDLGSFQHGGVIVPGQGSGDKVPAMLEPGEVVWNREAVKRYFGSAERADQINKLIPRFAKGGKVGGFGAHLDFALGPYDIPPIQYAADHAGGNSHVHITMDTPSWAVAIGKRLQQMGWMVGENPAFGGVNAVHSATGGHYDGTAIDANTAEDETRAQVAAVARLLSGAGGAVAEKIARVLLKGPDGPLKDMGQSALDKVRSAANKFISSKAPAGVAATSGNYNGPLNRIFPHWTTLANPGVQLSESQTWELAHRAGLPRVFTEVAWRESGRHPGIMGVDPGGTRGLGMWMITTGFNDELIRKFGGEDQMANPWRNAQAAKVLYNQGGLQPWAPSGPYQRGGLVGLQRGGLVNLPGKGNPLDFGGVLDATRSHDNDPDKRTKAVTKAVERFQDAVKGFGLPSKLVEKLVALRHDADVFYEYAGNASSLSDEGVLGKFRGLTEAEWTEKQLDALFKLRNRLVVAKKIIEKRIKDQVKLLKEAEKRLRDTNKAIRLGDRERGDLEDRLEKAKEAKNKDLVKQLEAKLESLDERQDLRKAVAAKLKTPIISSLKGLGGRLKSGGAEFATRESLADALTTVQGLDGPTRKLKKLPALGTLGGEIFDAQLRLRDLGREANPTDLGISIDELRSVIEAARYGVFDYADTFHTGGVVPGSGDVPIVAQGGEGVFTRDQMAAMGKGTTQITVENNFDWQGMDLYVETKVNGQIHKREKVSRRRGRQVVR